MKRTQISGGMPPITLQRTACVKGSRHSWHHRHHWHRDAPWPHFEQPHMRWPLCISGAETSCNVLEHPKPCICFTGPIPNPNFGGGYCTSCAWRTLSNSSPKRSNSRYCAWMLRGFELAPAEARLCKGAVFFNAALNGTACQLGNWETDGYDVVFHGYMMLREP